MTIQIYYAYLKRTFKYNLRSYISLTVFNSEQKIVGCACFNDIPQGLQGKYDNKHYNLW